MRISAPWQTDSSSDHIRLGRRSVAGGDPLAGLFHLVNRVAAAIIARGELHGAAIAAYDTRAGPVSVFPRGRQPAAAAVSNFSSRTPGWNAPPSTCSDAERVLIATTVTNITDSP
jgi:hypothetical protein